MIKRFIANLFLFGFFCLACTVILIVLAVAMQRTFISFELPKNKTILITGDSRPECALNDEILANTFNFARSGSGYFYSYLKIRKMLDANPQIDTVVLGCSWYDLRRSLDQWFCEDTYIYYYLPRHLFLCHLEDVAAIFRSNPPSVLRSLPMAIGHIPLMLDGRSELGGYRYLVRDKLTMDKKRRANSPEIREFGIYGEAHLRQIYQLTESRSVHLVLLILPMHPMMLKDQEPLKARFRDLTATLPRATVIDHSAVSVPESGFGDLEHLNHQGAAFYSTYLRDRGILESATDVSSRSTHFP